MISQDEHVGPEGKAPNWSRLSRPRRFVPRNLDAMPEYYPRNYDPSHLIRLGFLQACERLGVPVGERLKIDIVQLPPEPLLIQPCSFKPPQIDLFRPAESLKAVYAEILQYFERLASWVLQLDRQTMIPANRPRRAGPKREIPPQALRCEWAVRHYRGESWASIARSQQDYTLEQVKKNGSRILRALPGRGKAVRLDGPQPTGTGERKAA